MTKYYGDWILVSDHRAILAEARAQLLQKACKALCMRCVKEEPVERVKQLDGHGNVLDFGWCHPIDKGGTSVACKADSIRRACS